ncbi:MAG: hypothetical protein JWO39_2897 [Gemmatimonadetes bacterium]|nr:hypothetical protein [Gemmatimonadota bacterium]
MHSMTNISSSRFARAAVAAVAVALLAACGSDSSTGTRNANVAGTYNLSTVNSSALPYTVPHTTDPEVVEQASITLNTDSTYAVLATGTVNGSSSTIAADAGHYTVTGSQVTFTSTIITSAQYTASATSSGLTATIPGAFVGSSDISFTLVFTKAS